LANNLSKARALHGSHQCVKVERFDDWQNICIVAYSHEAKS